MSPKLPLSQTRRTVLLGLLTAALTSCGVSPSLPPLPPPDEPTQFNFVREGVVLVGGTLPVEVAKVYILNRQTSEIFGMLTQKPRYEIEVEGRPGHQLLLWYSSGGETSDTFGFEFPDPDSEIPPQSPQDAGP